MLGYFHFFGDAGVPKDELKGAQYWWQAALQGHDRATYWLAYCFRNGYGVEQDVAVADALSAALNNN